MAKKGKSDNWELEPQKSCAAQILTHVEFHAHDPTGLEKLTTRKYVITGDGMMRK